MLESIEPNGGEFYFGLKQRIYNWNMRSARESKGWRQKDLAESIGIGIATISQIETLRFFPSNGQAERIAAALGRRVTQLFPAWLREFKLERVPRSSDEEKIALHEIPIALLPPSSLTYEMEDPKIGNLPVDIQELLKEVTPRERRVLQLRFGLEDGQSRTCEEVGREVGVTRERIRQIEAKALRKLRHPKMAKRLVKYLE